MPSLTRWTTETWNPVIGCDKWSDGCKNCYAREIALRLQRQGVSDYEQGFKVHILPHRLNGPLSWKKPRNIKDLWYTGNFDETYWDIVEGCDAFLKYLKKRRIISFNL